MNESMVVNFFIHYILALFWIYGLFQDIRNAFKIRSTGVKSNSVKSRDKMIKRQLGKIEALLAKGNDEKIVEILTNKENRELLKSS